MITQIERYRDYADKRARPTVRCKPWKKSSCFILNCFSRHTSHVVGSACVRVYI